MQAQQKKETHCDDLSQTRNWSILCFIHFPCFQQINVIAIKCSLYMIQIDVLYVRFLESGSFYL